MMVWLISIAYTQLYAQTPDPGRNGNFSVSSDEYDFGNEWYSHSVQTADNRTLKAEAKAKIYYPTTLSTGAHSIIFIMHGRHPVCYDASNPELFVGQGWPCEANQIEIPSYRGYDYLGEHLASHGYLVVSIGVNGANNIDDLISGAGGMAARATILQHHINFWKDWNANGGGPFGTRFRGKLDVNNIGVIGHSRGGEGVALHSVVGSQDVKAVLTLAPTSLFFVPGLFPKKSIPYCNITGYCDGDLSDQQGVSYYDSRRYDGSVTAPSHSVLLTGANHNYFNTLWTTFPAFAFDDWGDLQGKTDSYCSTEVSSNRRFTATKQRNAAKTYIGAFFRRYLGNETQFDPILQADDTTPPRSSGLRSNEAFVSYHPVSNKRVEINRYDETRSTSSTTNTLGGQVNQSLLTTNTICEDISCVSGILRRQMPHETYQLNVGWGGRSNRTWYENKIPAANKNFSSYENIMFRAAVNFKDSSPNRAMNFYVELVDSRGNSDKELVSTHSQALYFPPGGTGATGSAKIMHNTVKIPLSSFNSTLDLTNITSVRFVFDFNSNGNIFITDLMLSDDATSTAKDIVIAESLEVIKAYPNPTNGILNFNFSDQKHQKVLYSITDMQGRKMIPLTKLREGERSISLESYPSGIYILKLQIDDRTTTDLIIKED